MKFLHREIHSFQDSQRNFEQLEPLVSGGTLDTVTAALVRTNLGLPDGSGSAPFLQLAVAQRLGLNLGVATFTWPGASAYSNNIVINHGLGRTPSLAAGAPGQSPGGGAAFPFLNAAPGTTTITLAAYSPTSTPTVGQTTTMAWWVLG